MASGKVDLLVRGNGVAIITMNNPPTNTLSNAVMDDLEMIFEEAYFRSDVKTIVLTGANGNFCSGVDIKLFQVIQRRGCNDIARFVPAVPFMKMIEDGPKPVVAAIEGFAMGSGLEFAMACHARISAHTARFSMPDFHLGILPGLGGTQRLPRLAGIQRTLEIFWMTRPLTASEALNDGIVDTINPTADVLETACKWALDIAEKRRPWLKTLERTDRLESLEEALHILRRARVKERKHHPNLVHTLLCIDAMEEGIRRGGLAGVMMEEKLSHGLVSTPPAKALMHVFLSRRVVSKVNGIKDTRLIPRQIKKAGIWGSSLTGAAIATNLIMFYIPTYIKARNKSELQSVLQLIEENLKNLVIKRTITEKQSQKMAALVNGTISSEGFCDVNLMIEAVEEVTENRTQIFQELAEVCATDCILASSSSMVDLNLIAADTCQDRIVGCHFMSPAYDSELLEISRTSKTSPQVLIDVLSLGKYLKKLPLVVNSSKGLIVDRLCRSYHLAGSLLTHLGVDPDLVNACAVDFGMRNGPLTFLSDERGNIAPEFRHYLERSQKFFQSTMQRKAISIPDEDISDMIIFPVVIEAYQILKENAVANTEGLDVASILGLGFPNYRGGIIFWAESVGTEFILSQLSKWSDLYGNCFKPSSPYQLTVADFKKISEQVAARL